MTRQLSSSNPAMSNLGPTCGPVKGFVRPSLGFRWSKCILWLTT